MMISYFESPLGWLKITTSDLALLGIDYCDQPKTWKEPTSYALEVIKQLTEYFQGQRKQFNLKLERTSPNFTFKVWQALENIPFGQVKTYSQVAKELGNLQASRAVGNACHINPLAIVVPCHRVIGSSPKSGGYASGMWRKNWLIKHEQKSSS